MKCLRLTPLAVALCTLLALGQADLLPPKGRTIDLAAPMPVSSEAPETTAPPNTTSSTTTETPTTEKPTTTTQNPTTTTQNPTTTTEKPTTTTQKPTTTTQKPTTTPAPPPTPAPKPGPVPNPSQGKWWYTDKVTNVTCIGVQFAAQLNVTYTKMVENATAIAHVIMNVRANATVINGSCAGNITEHVTLSWAMTEGGQWNNLTMMFHRNDTSKTYILARLDVQLSRDLFVNASANGTIELWHENEWQTPVATSYRCEPATKLTMTTSGVDAAVLTISQLQEEAFRTTASKGFSAARECGSGDVPDAVPIAVGCALGGLVVVVLIAYLVGRRRSAARGYLSM